MAAPSKNTVEFILRVNAESVTRIKKLAETLQFPSGNKLGMELLLASLEILEFQGQNPPMPYDLIRLREILHGAGRSGTYVDEPSSVVREEPTVEEKRMDTFSSMQLLDMLNRELERNAKLQDKIFELMESQK